ncbi:MAG: Ig-like domain-containing protein [Chloroflexi bacterium]|nr:Ig-like domain-containing protein [Chloroflexota bacterium]
MRRLLVALAAAAVIAAGCTDSAEGPPPGAGVVAEVQVPGQPPALTHGDDPLLPRPPSLVAQTPPEAPWPCEGTGTDGRRVQLLYVHGGNGNLAALLPTFEAWARQIEGMFLTSARATGGERLVRFVTGPGCALDIADVTVSANALGSFDAMIAELRGRGFADDTRSYHAWVEASAYCGIGTIYGDDRRTGNWNEQYAHYARSDRPCWTANTAAHEIVHNLGGVQNSAPNSTGGLHCRDEHDVMCYPDGAPRGQMVTVCADATGEDRLDCRGDDYFSTPPAPGSYLAGHWNVADSSALSRSTTPPTTPPPPTTSTSTTLPPTTSTSIGKGKVTVELSAPSSIRRGAPFAVLARVTGECRPTGVVGFYVGGRLMSRQVLADGDASVALTINSAVGRPTIRADYAGDERCATGRDTARVRVT